MTFTQERKGNTAVFIVSGRLDSNTSQEVEKKILDAIQEGMQNVILNFSSLDYISSAGIRVLVRCHKELEKKKGTILLAALPKPIENVLYITGFLPYFKVYESTDQALKSVGANTLNNP